MKKTMSLITVAAFSAILFTGCAESNYSTYNSYDNKTDRMAQDTMHDAASQLSAQDIKNINNLK